MNPNKNDIDNWILTLQTGGLSPDTIYLRRRHVDRALTHIGKHTSTMTADDLVTWFAAQEWKPANRRGYRVSLGLFFAWLEKPAGETTSLPGFLPYPSYAHSHDQPKTT